MRATRARYPKGSGGTGKRVGIARAIIARPRYLLVEERLAGLDPGIREPLLALLLWLWRGRAPFCG